MPNKIVPFSKSDLRKKVVYTEKREGLLEDLADMPGAEEVATISAILVTKIVLAIIGASVMTGIPSYLIYTHHFKKSIGEALQANVAKIKDDVLKHCADTKNQTSDLCRVTNLGIEALEINKMGNDELFAIDSTDSESEKALKAKAEKICTANPDSRRCKLAIKAFKGKELVDIVKKPQDSNIDK